MAKLTPYIISEDARAQAEFYRHALGGEILSVVLHDQPQEAFKDKVMHLSMVVGGTNLFMTDSVFGAVSRGNGMNLSLEFATEAEAYEAFNNLAEGGNVTHPLAPAFWGTLYGEVDDKFGVTWMITNESATSQS